MSRGEEMPEPCRAGECVPHSIPEYRLEQLAERFRRFAVEECRHYSPLYERLSQAVAEDPEMLALAGYAREGQPVPHLFFAAVQFFLLKGVRHPVSAFYPSLSGNSSPEEGPYPYFRDFCREHAGEIRALLSTRRAQTNEVRRCACLLPAFGLVAAAGGGRPLSLVEIGASAGLNLLWDRYVYDYGDGLVGDAASPVRIRCAPRGVRRPPIPARFPAVDYRVGLDLNPIDMGDLDATLWLRALVWPEHTERADLLKRVLMFAQEDPPPVLAGDALDLLPGVLDSLPANATPCVFHSFTVNQFSAEARERLSSLLAEHAARRDLFRISLEGRQEGPVLELLSYERDLVTERRLALCHPHGEWLEWLEAEGYVCPASTSSAGRR